MELTKKGKKEKKKFEKEQIKNLFLIKEHEPNGKIREDILLSPQKYLNNPNRRRKTGIVNPVQEN